MLINLSAMRITPNMLMLMVGLFCAMTTMGQIDQPAIEKLINKTVDGKTIQGAVLSVSKGDQTAHFSAGNISKNQPFFIASVSKLYTACIIFQLETEGKLKLSDPIINHLAGDSIERLHVLDDVDYTPQITIQHLLAHTSGLPDYFDEKMPNGTTLFDGLKVNQDSAWGLPEVLNASRLLKPHFAPGTPGKAYYSDTNYQLLGRIIERLTGQTYAEVVQERIIKPLGLKSTYVFTGQSDTGIAKFYYDELQLNIPKAMTSFGCDGGIVSTQTELLIFLLAYLKGELFPFAYLQKIQEWNKIFFPFNSGIGLMQFSFPGNAKLIGHSGASGCFAYADPDGKYFIVGTTNQLADQPKTYKLLSKVAFELKK